MIGKIQYVAIVIHPPPIKNESSAIILYVTGVGTEMFDETLEDGDLLEREWEGDPVLLWWTGFTGELGTTKSCGDVKCFVTVKRKYLKEKRTQVSRMKLTVSSHAEIL